MTPSNPKQTPTPDSANQFMRSTGDVFESCKEAVQICDTWCLIIKTTCYDDDAQLCIQWPLGVLQLKMHNPPNPANILKGTLMKFWRGQLALQTFSLFPGGCCAPKRAIPSGMSV